MEEHEEKGTWRWRLILCLPPHPRFCNWGQLIFCSPWMSHLEMVSSQCMDFPMNLGTFNAYNTQPLKFMFPNSSSNQFNIPTSQQYNNHTFISPANNHMPFPTLFPWSMWNKGTCPLKAVQDTWSIFSNHTHSFSLPTIICYFLHSFPRAHGLKAQPSLEAVQDTW